MSKMNVKYGYGGERNERYCFYIFSINEFMKFQHR